MLVLPPFQRMGLGAEMLNTIYSNYQSDARVLDITGEEKILLFDVFLVKEAAQSCMVILSCATINFSLFTSRIFYFHELFALELLKKIKKKKKRKEKRRIYKREHPKSTVSSFQWRIPRMILLASVILWTLRTASAWTASANPS